MTFEARLTLEVRRQRCTLHVSQDRRQFTEPRTERTGFSPERSKRATHCGVQVRWVARLLRSGLKPVRSVRGSANWRRS